MDEALYRVGIDIGGTKVNIGLVRPNGSVVVHRIISSSGAKQTKAFVDSICSELLSMLSSVSVSLNQVQHIGIGIPGTADSRHGIVEYSCNLFGENVPLGDYFQHCLGRPVFIVQDSWSAAWAEHLFGAGKGRRNMMCITIGTGIGCGVLLDGKILSGAMHTAGELGHTPIVWNGRTCSCGRKGCLEAYASGTAIWTQAMERFPEKLKGLPQQTESVFELASQNDDDALQLIEECVDKLAYGIALGMNLLAMDTVIISGGICAQQKFMIDPLPQRILSYGYPAWAAKRTITVLPAHLGADAPMVGAAFLTLDEMLLG